MQLATCDGNFSRVAPAVVQNSLDLLLPLPFGEYADQLDTLVNKDQHKLMKHIFDVFDFNQDGFIDEVDIYCIVKLCDFSHPSVGRKVKEERATLPAGAQPPQSEADKAIKQREAVSEITHTQSRFEVLIQSDLIALSLFLESKQNRFENHEFNKDKLENQLSALHLSVSDAALERQRYYLIKKRSQYKDKGDAEEEAEVKVNQIIEEIY